MKAKRKFIERTDHLLSKEKGTVFKEHGGNIRICLVYPNTYHIGMSNLGFRIVYSLFNKRNDVVCERAFLPDVSGMDEYKRTETEIFSMESKKSLAHFDVVAFSVSFENDYPNIVEILNMSKIPIHSKDRDAHYPLFIMGGPCAFMNPEPLSPFFDMVFVGEAEVLIDDFVDAYKRSNHKDELYENIKGKDGIYVPAFYEVRYLEDGRVKERLTSKGFPDKINRCCLEDMNQFSHVSQIVADETEFSNMFLVEAMRGCPWNCRFCATGKIYNPPRKKGLEAISEEIQGAKASTERVGVLGPSLSDYPFIADVLCIDGVEFSITSLRASSKSAEIVSLIKNKKSISIAPEAGTKRLREVILKRITQEDILETSRLIFEEGIETLKLYFMVGLPTETDEDIQGIIDLVREIRGLSKRGSIVLSVSTFVPKPSTPFQWHPMEELSTVKRRLKMLRRELQMHHVKVFHDVPKYAYMQGLFAMGDRRVAKVLESMVTTNDWKEACEVNGIDPDFYTSRKKTYDEMLPWDFINNKIDKKRLWDEYSEAVS